MQHKTSNPIAKDCSNCDSYTKNIAEIAGTVQSIDQNKLSSKLRRVVKLLIFLLNLYHLLHQVVEQQVIMVRQCVDETY